MKCLLNPQYFEADCSTCKVRHSCYQRYGFKQRFKGKGNGFKKALTAYDKKIISKKQFDELFLLKLLNKYNYSLTDIARITQIPKADLHAKITSFPIRMI